MEGEVDPGSVNPSEAIDGAPPQDREVAPEALLKLETHFSKPPSATQPVGHITTDLLWVRKPV